MAGRKKKSIKPFGDGQQPTRHNAIDLPDHDSGDYDREGYDSGTEEEQEEFKQEVELFHMERGMEFKPPKFYREEINLLKLWKVVMNLGGYEHVTSCKLWRNIGELFNPPKSCTTVAFAFRGLYQKALLEYENHKTLSSNEVPDVGGSHKRNSKIPKKYRDSEISSRSVRPPRTSAIRAKEVWQSLKVSSSHNYENKVEDLFVPNKNKESGITMMKKQKNGKELKTTSNIEEPHLPLTNSEDEQMNENLSAFSAAVTDFEVFDVGPPATWVKINVFTTADGFEVFALVPGLSREDVQIDYDSAGHILISGQPENPDDPWGLFPFKKVIELPSRINPHKTSAVVTLQGQLFIRAPFEQSEA